MQTSKSPDPKDHPGHDIKAQPTGQNDDIERAIPRVQQRVPNGVRKTRDSFRAARDRFVTVGRQRLEDAYTSGLAKVMVLPST